MAYSLYSKTNQYIIDSAITGIAFYLAYQIRFEGAVPQLYVFQLWLFPAVIAGRLLTNYLFGIYRRMWRYVAVADVVQIAAAYAAFSAVLLLIRLSRPERFVIFLMPVGVIIIELLLSLLGACGVRLLRRTLYERKPQRADEQRKVRRLLLVGAGSFGALVAKEMAKRPGIQLVGFVDDDPEKANASIAGVPVLGPIASLPTVLKDRNVDEVFVCIPPSSGRTLTELWQICANLPVPVRLVPSVGEPLDVEESRLPRETAVVTHRVGKFPDSPPIRSKNILITGGAGFIGSSLAEKLANDNRLVLFDRQFDRQPITFSALPKHPNVRLVQGDILDTGVLRPLALEADIVVHAAAVVGVETVHRSPRLTLETNFGGVSHLLGMLEPNRHLQRLIYFSTSEVFGVHSFRVGEDSPPSIGPIADARWSYAVAKLAGEHLVQAYHRETGMPIVIVRPFNVFGPRRVGDYAMGRFILSALGGCPLEVHGDGSQIRAWCYIEDFIAALLAMLSRSEAVGEDFNIGNPKNTLTVHQLASKVLLLTGASAPIVFTKTDIPDVMMRVPSLAKAQELLGYEPEYDLDHGLELTIEWYRKHWTFFSSQFGGMMPRHLGQVAGS